jgi:predicted regulator of Ras-like GTPase activity (Roadblock/LC7/MglB family)
MHPDSRRFSQTVTNAVNRYLSHFVASNPAVTMAVLTSNDGFEIAAQPANRASTQRLAAMSSSMRALSDALVVEAGMSKCRTLLIESEAGAIVVFGIANTEPSMSLAVVASASNPLGHTLWACRNCCSLLEDVLKSG